MSTDFLMNLGSGRYRTIQGDEENQIYVDTGDIDIPNGKINLIAAPATDQQTGQKLYVSLMLRQGEWFGDVSAGFPYRIFAKYKTEQAVFNTLMRSYILSQDNVVRLVEYKSELNAYTRKLDIYFEAAIAGQATTTQVEFSF